MHDPGGFLLRRRSGQDLQDHALLLRLTKRSSSRCVTVVEETATC